MVKNFVAGDEPFLNIGKFSHSESKRASLRVKSISSRERATAAKVKKVS